MIKKLCHGPCGQRKPIHCYAPAAWKHPYGVCQKCQSEKNAQHSRRTSGLGNSVWRGNMKKHFLGGST